MRYVFLQNFNIASDNKSIVGYLKVTKDWEVFLDHFPGFPILPGALIIETMAQHAVALMLKSKPVHDAVMPNLIQVDQVKFLEPVIPDCELKICIKEAAKMYPNFKFIGEVFKEESLVANARLTMTFRPMPNGMGLDFLNFFAKGN